MMKFNNAIELNNSYIIDRPDERNYALYHYEPVNKVKMLNGEKLRGEDGKLVYEVSAEWVWKGYYGNLKGLMNGMIEHKCHTANIDTLEQMLGLIKEFINELEYVSKL